MGIYELLVIALGLSMDAFAVALCKGLEMKRPNLKRAVIIALFFGVFQAVMPLIGWVLGVRFTQYITEVDHWIAFLLLGFIGGRMIFSSHNTEENGQRDDALDIKELFILAIATSIDALAVGITFAFLQVEIIQSCLIIGASTFMLSLLGVAVGNRFGARLKQKAEIIGGVVLILIGLKILLEHLGVL